MHFQTITKFRPKTDNHEANLNIKGKTGVAKFLISFKTTWVKLLRSVARKEKIEENNAEQERGSAHHSRGS